VESKSLSESAKDPEPQLIAGAIAIFQALRRLNHHIPEISIPGITMRGDWRPANILLGPCDSSLK